MLNKIDLKNNTNINNDSDSKQIQKNNKVITSKNTNNSDGINSCCQDSNIKIHTCCSICRRGIKQAIFQAYNHRDVCCCCLSFVIEKFNLGDE